MEPSTLALTQSSMRSHLTSCFENNAMTPFPEVEETTVTRCPKISVIVDIHCSCHLPWFDEDRVSRSQRMASVTNAINVSIKNVQKFTTKPS